MLFYERMNEIDIKIREGSDFVIQDSAHFILNKTISLSPFNPTNLTVEKT